MAETVLGWAFEHGLAVGWVSVGLALLVLVPLGLLLTLSRGVLHGAKLLAAGWVWREAWRSWRHPGGAGGSPRHSREYVTYMASPEWRQRRLRLLRRAGRRCQACGGRATQVHHRWYARPLGAEPDAALEALCARCHARAHGGLWA